MNTPKKGRGPFPHNIPTQQHSHACTPRRMPPTPRRMLPSPGRRTCASDMGRNRSTSVAATMP
eukprot:353848-Chlamydomonas_euryale.AAC.4